jgi:hypothetical protein
MGRLLEEMECSVLGEEVEGTRMNGP